jgi:hypothetical protein
MSVKYKIRDTMPAGFTHLGGFELMEVWQTRRLRSSAGNDLVRQSNLMQQI